MSILLNGRKGAAIVEGAIIFPIIVLTASIIISIIISLYSMLALKVDCDLAVRSVAGEMTKILISPINERSKMNDRVYKEDAYFGLFPEVRINCTQNYGWDSFVSSSISKEEASFFSLHNESRFIRNVDLISEGLTSEAERFLSQNDKMAE